MYVSEFLLSAPRTFSHARDNSLALLDTESGAITPLSAQLPDGSAGGIAWDGRETIALAVDMGVYLLEEGQGNAHLAANTLRLVRL